jgi:hypothetical protein
MYKLYKIKKEIMIKLISVTKPRPYKIGKEPTAIEVLQAQEKMKDLL